MGTGREEALLSGYVCLGWGSLLWDPGSLPRRGEWQADGPQLPVEFARVSGDGRLTLIVHPACDPVQTYWTYLEVSGMTAACRGLARRERCRSESIGWWEPAGGSASVQPLALPLVDRWAAGRGFDGVVWTDLPSRFAERAGSPWSPDAALRYVRSLPEGDLLDRVEEYICRAPVQTRTRTRTLLEQELGWTPR